MSVCGDDADNTELAREYDVLAKKFVRVGAGCTRTADDGTARVACVCCEQTEKSWRAEDLVSPQNLGRELDELEAKPNVPGTIRCSS